MTTPEHFSVLDALVKVREEIDPSLALRCSCRAAICGSCAMRVERPGAPRLQHAHQLPLSMKAARSKVEPMGNQRVVKDLVIDLQLFWGKVRAVEPYLQPDAGAGRGVHRIQRVHAEPADAHGLHHVRRRACRTVRHWKWTRTSSGPRRWRSPTGSLPTRATIKASVSASSTLNEYGGAYGTAHAVTCVSRSARRASRRWTASWSCAKSR